MMRIAGILCAACLVASLLGCLPALHPYFTEKTLIQADEYVGTWRSSDEIWTISKAERDCYPLELSGEGAAGRFRLRFFRLSGTLFADITPLKEWDNLDYFGMLLAPMHLVARVEGSGDTISVGILDGDWYTKQVEAGALDLEMVELDDAACVMAPSSRLQETIVKYANDSSAFPMERMYREKSQQ